MESKELNQKEWLTMGSGTKGVKVKTYNDSGKLIDIVYIVYESKDDDFYDLLEDAQSVSIGYMTDTNYVIRA